MTDFTGNYQLYFLNESDILTNCLRALAQYRQHAGEFWPARVIINRNTRLSLGFGPDIKVIRPGKSEANWPLLGALYMFTDDPMRDPANQRVAKAMQVRIRQPVEDVYGIMYRFRAGSDTGYVMKLPGA